jgi:hypothetical protein
MITDYIFPNILQITSLLFLTNFIHNTWYKEYIYAWLFLLLTVTSTFIYSGIFKDSIENDIIYLDKTIVLMIAIYGGYLFKKAYLFKETSSIPIVTFLTTAYMYISGYFLNRYSFDPNISIANFSHAMIHIIGCLGHHSIIYEYGKLLRVRKFLLASILLHSYT